MATELANLNGLKAPDYPDSSRRRFQFQGFQEFLDIYHLAGNCVRRPEDLKVLAHRYLSCVAKKGTLHVEFMYSPTHFASSGYSIEEQISSINQAFELAEHQGITASLIVTAVWHQGGETAQKLANEIAPFAKRELVQGFGLTGDETKGNPIDFAGAFKTAKDAGLGLTAHIGEWSESDRVESAIKHLLLDRVGHGVSIADDDQLIDLVAHAGIGIEVCLSSNKVLGRIDDPCSHPAKMLLQRGCRLSICSDDPGFFASDSSDEMKLAKMALALSEADLSKILKTSAQLAFTSESNRIELTRRAGIGTVS